MYWREKGPVRGSYSIGNFKLRRGVVVIVIVKMVPVEAEVGTFIRTGAW
jgi:hypothetical protein